MRTFGSHMSGFLSQYVQDEEIGLIFLQELWPQIVGAETAARMSPSRLRHRMLVVTVDSATWGGEVEKLKERLVHNINDLWGFSLVKEVRVEQAAGSPLAELGDRSF